MQDEASPFDCASQPPEVVSTPTWLVQTGSRLSRLRRARVDWWAGRYLLPASPRPFGRWFAAHVGDGRLLNATTVCLNGVWRTSRSRILQRPKAYYRHLAEQTNVGNLVEAAQYTEFAAGAIFGGGDPEVGPAESA